MPIDGHDFSTQSDRHEQEPAERRSQGSSPCPDRRRYGSDRSPEQHLPQQRKPSQVEDGPAAAPPTHPAGKVGNPEQAPWSYQQRGHGNERRFTGKVHYIGGREGERRRAELAAVLDKLLRWAASEQQANQSQSRNDRDAA